MTGAFTGAVETGGMVGSFERTEAGRGGMLRGASMLQFCLEPRGPTVQV